MVDQEYTTHRLTQQHYYNMAEIIAYPLGQPDRQSQLIGTQVGVLQPNGQEINVTRNFTVDSILSLLDNQFILAEFSLNTAELQSLAAGPIVLVRGEAGKFIEVNSAFIQLNDQTVTDYLDFAGDMRIETTKPIGWYYEIPSSFLNSLTLNSSYKPALTAGISTMAEGAQVSFSGAINTVNTPVTKAKISITYRFIEVS